MGDDLKKIHTANGSCALRCPPLALRLLLAMLVVACIVAPAWAAPVTLEDGQYRTVLILREDGSLDNGHGSHAGHVRGDGYIEDGSHRTLGRLRSGGSIEDASGRTLGRVRSDGYVEDASHRTVGVVRNDGGIQDASYRTLGHVRGARFDKQVVGALWFFFLHRLRP